MVVWVVGWEVVAVGLVVDVDEVVLLELVVAVLVVVAVDVVVAVLLEEDFSLPAFKAELEAQLAALERSEIASEALSKSFAMLVSSREEALEFSNAYAPEHLVIQTGDPSCPFPLHTFT